MVCFKKEHCRLCESTSLQSVIQLTPTPPGNHFVSKAQVGQEQTCYPLEVDFCQNCNHVQLAHVVDPKILYKNNYTYVSGTSQVFVKHLSDYANHITSRYSLPKTGLVLDIGSNDGTALSFFKNKGYRTLGIDPATEIVQRANELGIETLCEFFSEAIAQKYRPDYGQAHLISSHNTCAHIDDLVSVVKGAKYWLAKDGLFVIEVGYFLDVFENIWFDTIYHEHVDFHTVAPLVKFFDRLDMEVIAVERVSPQGGSIRVITQHKAGPYQKDNSVEKLIALEQEKGLDKAVTLINMQKNIERVKHNLSKLIASIKNKGQRIAAYGAPTKAVTLLSHFELASALDFLVEDNPLKQGLFSPGYHIPVLPAEAIYEKKPDFLLVLAWNFSASIIEKHELFREQGGKFILPMPEATIV